LIVNGLISGDYTGYNATNAIEKDFKRIAPMFKVIGGVSRCYGDGSVNMETHSLVLDTWGERLINQTGFRILNVNLEPAAQTYGRMTAVEMLRLTTVVAMVQRLTTAT
jgi:hypothetical protein